MTSTRRRAKFGTCCAVAVAVCAALVPAPAAVSQELGLRIRVLEGEDSVNIIEQGTAVPTLVEVRDRNDLPVAGASVLFLLGDGGTATLNAGVQQVALTTNALGQAAVTVNPVASGAVQLSVNASFQGQTATAAIVQTNFATVAEAAAAGVGATGGAGGGSAGSSGAGAGGGSSGGLGTGTTVGIAGAAAGAAVGVAVAAAGDDSTTRVPATPGASDDRGVLIELYSATNGANWLNSTNWNSSEPLSMWHGVETDGNGRVTALSLAANWLQGPIPSSLGRLTRLTVLDLTINGLDGPIPSSLGRLTRLAVLDLSFNGLTGSIPSSLGNLRNLETLDLGHLYLTGSIPSSLGNLTSLEDLWLYYNQLSGPIPGCVVPVQVHHQPAGGPARPQRESPVRVIVVGAESGRTVSE